MSFAFVLSQQTSNIFHKQFIFIFFSFLHVSVCALAWKSDWMRQTQMNYSAMSKTGICSVYRFHGWNVKFFNVFFFFFFFFSQRCCLLSNLLRPWTVLIICIHLKKRRKKLSQTFAKWKKCPQMVLCTVIRCCSYMWIKQSVIYL